MTITSNSGFAFWAISPPAASRGSLPTVLRWIAPEAVLLTRGRHGRRRSDDRPHQGAIIVLGMVGSVLPSTGGPPGYIPLEKRRDVPQVDNLLGHRSENWVVHDSRFDRAGAGTLCLDVLENRDDIRKLRSYAEVRSTAV